VQLGENPDKKGTAYLGVHYFMGPNGGFRRGLPFNGNPNLLPGTQGAIIRNVTANSPAAQAGLKAGDVISAADGKTIDSPQALVDVIASHKPNDQITLSVQHSDGTKSDVKVTLGEDPNKKGAAYMGVSIGSAFRIQRPNGIPGQNGQGQRGQRGFNRFFGGPGGQPNTQPPQQTPGNTL
jgi:membrane-associated protease RseP (regulator of RpoE activity)